MDFFKTVMDGVSKDDATDDQAPNVQEEEQHNVYIYLFLSLFIHGDAFFL